MLEIITDFPERLRPGVVVFVGEDHKPLQIDQRRGIHEGMLVSFNGYTSPEEVGQLRNCLVYVRADDRPPLLEGEYYQHQVLGLRVISEEGVLLGKLSHILDTGANDVFVVRPESGPEILLPVISSVILNIDLDKGEILVHLLPGLIPD